MHAQGSAHVFSRLCPSARPWRRMAAVVAALLQAIRHRPGGGSLWYGDQPQGDGRRGALCSKGGMISPPLPRSPGLGTGTRFGGSYCGGIWAHGTGLLRATCKEIEGRGSKQKTIVISQSPAHGQGGGPMGPFFGIILTCGVSHPLHIGRPPSALLWLSNQIAPRPSWGPNPTIFPAGSRS